MRWITMSVFSMTMFSMRMSLICIMVDFMLLLFFRYQKLQRSLSENSLLDLRVFVGMLNALFDMIQSFLFVTLFLQEINFVNQYLVSMNKLSQKQFILGMFILLVFILGHFLVIGVLSKIQCVYN